MAALQPLPASLLGGADEGLPRCLAPRAFEERGGAAQSDAVGVLQQCVARLEEDVLVLSLSLQSTQSQIDQAKLGRAAAGPAQAENLMSTQDLPQQMPLGGAFPPGNARSIARNEVAAVVAQMQQSYAKDTNDQCDTGSSSQPQTTHESKLCARLDAIQALLEQDAFKSKDERPPAVPSDELEQRITALAIAEATKTLRGQWDAEASRGASRLDATEARLEAIVFRIEAELGAPPEVTELPGQPKRRLSEWVRTLDAHVSSLGQSLQETNNQLGDGFEVLTREVESLRAESIGVHQAIQNTEALRLKDFQYLQSRIDSVQAVAGHENRTGAGAAAAAEAAPSAATAAAAESLEAMRAELRQGEAMRAELRRSVDDIWQTLGKMQQEVQESHQAISHKLDVGLQQTDMGRGAASADASRQDEASRAELWRTVSELGQALARSQHEAQERHQAVLHKVELGLQQAGTSRAAESAASAEKLVQDEAARTKLFRIVDELGLALNRLQQETQERHQALAHKVDFGQQLYDVSKAAESAETAEATRQGEMARVELRRSVDELWQAFSTFQREMQERHQALTHKMEDGLQRLIQKFDEKAPPSTAGTLHGGSSKMLTVSPVARAYEPPVTAPPPMPSEGVSPAKPQQIPPTPSTVARNTMPLQALMAPATPTPGNRSPPTDHRLMLQSAAGPAATTLPPAARTPTVLPATEALMAPATPPPGNRSPLADHRPVPQSAAGPASTTLPPAARTPTTLPATPVPRGKQPPASPMAVPLASATPPAARQESPLLVPRGSSPKPVRQESPMLVPRGSSPVSVRRSTSGAAASPVIASRPVRRPSPPRGEPPDAQATVCRRSQRSMSPVGRRDVRMESAMGSVVSRNGSIASVSLAPYSRPPELLPDERDQFISEIRKFQEINEMLQDEIAKRDHALQHKQPRAPQRAPASASPPSSAPRVVLQPAPPRPLQPHASPASQRRTLVSASPPPRRSPAQSPVFMPRTPQMQPRPTPQPANPRSLVLLAQPAHS